MNQSQYNYKNKNKNKNHINKCQPLKNNKNNLKAQL